MHGDVLKFGAWEVDLRADEFADIKFEGHKIIRSVRCVVRDRDWNTANLLVTSRTILDNEIRLEVRSEGFGSSFVGEVRANFENDFANFEMSLTSEKVFETNRTGLIVLNDPGVAGQALEVLHSNGYVEKSEFPKEISPNQPVFDIKSLTWSNNAESQIQIEFLGDVFEMEDQRNWTDASFKTYSRPLSLPFPYLVQEGEKIWQAIKVHAPLIGGFVEPNEKLIIELLQQGSAPALQINASTAPGVPPTFENFAQAELVEIDLQTSNWREALKRSQDSNLPIDVRVIYSSGSLSELDELVHLLEPKSVLRIGLFDSKQHISTEATDRLLRERLDLGNKQIPVVSGTRAHFTELNRNHEVILPGSDEVTFSSTPLFHSLSAAQLLEAVPIQRLTVLEAVRIAGGRPVHVGPITLRPRFNNVATVPAPIPTRSDLSEGYGAEFQGNNDNRQVSQELAAWTVASAIAFSVPGVASISWFESWGLRGIRDANGKDFPVATALSAICEFSGSTIYVGHDSKGEIWVMAALLGDGKITVLASNLGAQASNFLIRIENEEHNLELESLSWNRLSFATKLVRS